MRPDARYEIDVVWLTEVQRQPREHAEYPKVPLYANDGGFVGKLVQIAPGLGCKIPKKVVAHFRRYVAPGVPEQRYKVIALRPKLCILEIE